MARGKLWVLSSPEGDEPLNMLGRRMGLLCGGMGEISIREGSESPARVERMRQIGEFPANRSGDGFMGMITR
jgi:hypothetical protein